MNKNEIFLEAAIGIGKRLVKTAQWENENCTWEIMTPDRSQPQSKVAKKEIAGGTIYQGTSGIALFLCELYKISDDEKIKKAAAGAVNYAIKESKEMNDSSFGFHSGRVGIAYSAALLGKYFGDSFYSDKAIEILKPLHGNENKDHGSDVIGGAAGAIPILLNLTEMLNEDFIFEITNNLGDRLIETAIKEPTGWSWGGGNSHVRNLCGLAHGAAGYGHSFIELYNATGSSKFLYASEQAFLYERQFLNKQFLNWPDFRHSDLGEYIYNGQVEKLVQVVKEGKLNPYNTKYMNAWCHGSPGIGLTRIRAYDILRNKKYKEEAELAIAGTINAIKINNSVSNYSLCHGIGGNCDTLIYGHQIFDDTESIKVAEELAIEGWEKFEKSGKAWPCGTMNSVSDPSLMLGEAGIGHYFLRLYDNNIPSVLLPISKMKSSNSSDKAESYKELQKNYVNNYFEKSLQLIEKICPDESPGLINDSLNIGEPISDVSRTYDSISNFVKKIKEEKGKLIADAVAPDMERYELTIGVLDFTEEYLYELKKEKFDELDLKTNKFFLKPLVKLLEQKWDWEKWLRHDKAEMLPDEEENYKLLYRTKNRIHERKLNPLTFLILNSLIKPSTLDEMVSSISDSIDYTDVSELEVLKETITQQLKEAYNADLIANVKDSPIEEKIVETISEAVSNEIDQFTSYEKSRFNVQRMIRIFNEGLSDSDQLYNQFQTDTILNDLLRSLEDLHVRHYYEPFVSDYLNDKGDKEAIMRSLLNSLKKTFGEAERYIVEQ